MATLKQLLDRQSGGTNRWSQLMQSLQNRPKATPQPVMSVEGPPPTVPNQPVMSVEGPSSVKVQPTQVDFDKEIEAMRKKHEAAQATYQQSSASINDFIKQQATALANAQAERAAQAQLAQTQMTASKAAIPTSASQRSDYVGRDNNNWEAIRQQNNSYTPVSKLYIDPTKRSDYVGRDNNNWAAIEKNARKAARYGGSSSIWSDLLGAVGGGVSGVNEVKSIAAMGGLMTMLSDKKAKKDIERLTSKDIDQILGK